MRLHASFEPANRPLVGLNNASVIVRRVKPLAAWPRLAAVYVIVITPGIIAFTMAQKLFFKGLAEGVTKG